MAEDSEATKNIKKHLLDNDDPLDDTPFEIPKKEKKLTDEEEQHLAKEKAFQRDSKRADKLIREWKHESKEAQFFVHVDIAVFSIVGAVFFLTCIGGLLRGVSPKALSIRALISTSIAMGVMFLCRYIILKFHKPLELADEEDD